MKGLATLNWEVRGDPCECTVRLCNLTPDGMQALGPFPVAPGTRVFISGEVYECAGEIRYCVACEGEFRFGLEFSSDPYPVETGAPIQ